MVFEKVIPNGLIPYQKLESVSQLVVQHVPQVAMVEGVVLEFLGQAIPYLGGE